MTVDVAPARPWHVSDAFRAVERRGDEGSGPRIASVAPHPPPVMPPLWRRVVTGQVVRWRIRRLLNGLLWRRRRVARRAILWLDRHPEFRHVLDTEGPLRLGTFVMSAIRSSRTARPARPTHRHGHRPTVGVPSDLDATGLRDSVAAQGVELCEQSAAVARYRADFEDPFIVVVSADQHEVDLHVELLDAVDTSMWNPLWFQLSPNPYTVRITELPQGRRRRKLRARASIANRSRIVLCDDATSAVGTARTIAELATSGAPVVGAVSDGVAALLGPEVSEIIRTACPEDLLDNACRERHSLRLRRAALDSFSPRGRWRRIGDACGAPATATPSVTVLLASNRAADVIDAARQVAAQRVGNVQLLVGLHGSHMSPQLDEQLAESFPGDLVVRHLPDTFNLGQVLNALTSEAEGELVTKWDDDDWYDAEHLADLVAALDYSGADMVAKAAEFVYLESIDLTIRRFATGSERFSTTIAGGTLLLPRADLQEIGWADAPRRVDRLLIEALEARSRTVYRTHGFGYVLRRRGEALGQHTWQAGDAYFLRQSVDQRPGLDLAFAGFSEPSTPELAS